MNPLRIFISSVQKEFAEERAALRDYLRGDAEQCRIAGLGEPEVRVDGDTWITTIRRKPAASGVTPHEKPHVAPHVTLQVGGSGRPESQPESRPVTGEVKKLVLICLDSMTYATDPIMKSPGYRPTPFENRPMVRAAHV